MKSTILSLAPNVAKNAYHRIKKFFGGDIHVHVDRTILRHIARYIKANEFVRDCDVLDIACGSGYGALILSNAASYRGIDLDYRAIREAKREFSEFNYYRGSIYELPFSANSVTAITSFETLEHVDNPIAAMKELSRVLAPNGIFMVTTRLRKP